jgi:hypothetical protein
LRQAWAHFIRHIEIYLSLLGLLVIWTAGLIASHHAANQWQVIAWVAIAVGTLHGIIFWVVRSRQRQVRREDLNRARIVLQDVINNQLMVINLAASFDVRPSSSVEQIQASLRTIAAFLARFSEESLLSWESQQPRATLDLLHGRASLSANPD